MSRLTQWQSTITQPLREEVLAWWKLEQAVLPLTLLTDTLGVVQGLEREEAHCISDRNPNADELQKIFQAPRRIEQELGWRAQFVVTYVKAHSTGESRRPMNDKETLTQKAD